MNETRLTLISDATNEFPDNTNVDFKIRLAEPLHLKGEQRWQAAMASLSTPNSPAAYMKKLDVKMTDTLVVFGMRVLNEKYATSDPKHIDDQTFRRFTVGECFEDVAIDSLTGVEFWQRIASVLQHWQTYLMLRNARLNNSWAKYFDDEAVQMEVDAAGQRVRVKATDSNQTPAMFGLNMTVAKYFRLVSEPYPGRFTHGRNASYEGHRTFQAGRPQHRTKWPLESDMSSNDTALVVKPISDTGEKIVFYSRYLNWWFEGLNRNDLTPPAASIDDKTRDRTRLALVYCDLVQSTLVGNQKHALLRELTLHDTGGTRRSVEPLHYQWLPVRNNVIEVVHVQLADANGNVLTLPDGKTMLTVSLKQTV